MFLFCSFFENKKLYQNIIYNNFCYHFLKNKGAHVKKVTKFVTFGDVSNKNLLLNKIIFCSEKGLKKALKSY